MILVNVGSIKWFKWLALVWLVISDLYLFHLIFLLNPDFTCSKKLLSPFVDKVTTVTYNFVSFILNFAFVGLLTAATAGFTSGFASLVALLINTQFPVHVKIRFISQLINGMSSVLQKLLSYFNGTTISTSFVLLIFYSFPVMLVLQSKEFESLME